MRPPGGEGNEKWPQDSLSTWNHVSMNPVVAQHNHQQVTQQQLHTHTHTHAHTQPISSHLFLFGYYIKHTKTT
jgi:hypothetical protein